MNDEILEGNKLIAEFMELKPTEWGGMYSVSQDHCTCRESTPEKALNGFASIAKYHESWDWLMPAVEKIENLETEYSVTISKHTCEIHNILVKDIDVNIYKVEDSKNKATYIAIVEFIKWYNENCK